jgi:PPOX class probable F420-dependent enzyme
MVFAVTAGEIVSAIDWKPKHGRRLQRLVNIDATPTVSFLTHHYSDDWGELWWVRVDGVAATHTAGPAWAAAIDALRMKYDQYRDRPPEGEVIRIRVEAVASWSSTG